MVMDCKSAKPVAGRSRNGRMSRHPSRGRGLPLIGLRANVPER
jgi:hypothetical protein